MKYLHTILILSCCLYGCRSEEQIAYEESFKNESPSYIYILMREEDDRPKLDYEGYDQELYESRIKLPDEHGASEFELLVRRVPFDVLRAGKEKWREPKYIVVDFRGNMIRTGDDQFSLSGHLKTRIPVILQFVSMIESGDASGEEFPELTFEAGNHDVNFEGTITGWWKEETEESEE